MERKTDIISISKTSEIPSVDYVRTIPRGRQMKLVFGARVQKKREIIGQKLKDELTGFQVFIHTREPWINITKLITDEEIEAHQDFFEQCAKDYRKLGEEWLLHLVDELDLKLNTDYPLETFNELKRDKRQTGKIGDLRYFVHGFHCGFENTLTGQSIEVPLVFSMEFGDLDPYFFTSFIQSTPEYLPLPVAIFEDYADGVRIIEKMLTLGKFEKIHSNVGGHSGIVVTDRKKVEIKSRAEIEANYLESQRQNNETIQHEETDGVEKKIHSVKQHINYQKARQTNFFDPTIFQSLIERLECIQPNSGRKWGVVTPAQMLHHLNLAIGSGLGFYDLQDTSNVFSRIAVPFMILKVLKRFPIDTPTVKTLKVESEAFNFQTEKSRLQEILTKAFQTTTDSEWQAHTYFGRMSRKSWGQLIVIHCNHHFQQFGC